jgi:tetratricopeptide (TPR) repeat protein
MALAQDLSDEKYINTLPEEKKRETYARAINEAKTALRIVNKTDGYEILGTVFYTLNQFDSALVYYAEGLKIKPDHFALNFFMGKTLDKLKRFREAIPYLNVALSKEPENDGVLFNLALSYTNLNDLDKGLEYFSKIVQLKPGRADAYDYMGQIYRAKGDRANADLYFNKAREAEKNKTE